MNKEQFVLELEKINIEITKQQLKQLEKLYKLLLEWNQKINLTRITDEEEVYLKHFYDSLTLHKAFNLTEIKKLCDIGTGAGFPGLVLKIVFPHLQVTLVDSLNKRVIYLNEVIKELQLVDIEAVHSRGEDFCKTNKKYDVVTSRAVASLDKLFEYTIGAVKKDGYFIPLKANIEEELKIAEKSYPKYGIKLLKIETFTLPNEQSIRNIIVYQRKK